MSIISHIISTLPHYLTKKKDSHHLLGYLRGNPGIPSPFPFPGNLSLPGSGARLPLPDPHRFFATAPGFLLHCSPAPPACRDTPRFQLQLRSLTHLVYHSGILFVPAVPACCFRGPCYRYFSYAERHQDRLPLWACKGIPFHIPSAGCTRCCPGAETTDVVPQRPLQPRGNRLICPAQLRSHQRPCRL